MPTFADPRRPSTVDAHVARRLRNLREARELSQQDLADRAGVTYQQVQKYEKGASRISAGRLFDLARALDVGLPYFYFGLDGAGRSALAASVAGASARGVAESEAAYAPDPNTPDPVESLLEAFTGIDDPELRRAVLDVVRSASDLSRPPEPLGRQRKGPRGRKRRVR